jgi:hypothetical protein
MSIHRFTLFIFRIAVIGMFVLAGSAALRADILWDWTYVSPLYTGAGTLTTGDAPSSGSSYLITSFSGNWNSDLITGLLSPGIIGGNDNLVAENAPQLDGSGLSFSTAVDQFNIFRVDAVNYGAFGFSSAFDSGQGQFAATQEAPAVPESSTTSLILLGFGLLSAGVIRGPLSARSRL